MIEKSLFFASGLRAPRCFLFYFGLLLFFCTHTLFLDPSLFIDFLSATNYPEFFLFLFPFFFGVRFSRRGEKRERDGGWGEDVELVYSISYTRNDT
jgi:hypothetical protein